MNTVVTITLNPSIDYVMQVEKLEVEDTLRAVKTYYEPGGKGINVSRVLTRLGIATEAWGFCGGDTGKWLIALLDEEKIPHAFTQTDAATRINTILTELSTSKQLRVSASGSEITPDEFKTFLSQLDTLKEKNAIVTIGGSLPPGVTPEQLKNFVSHLSARQIRVILDADGKALKHGLEGKPFMIKPNIFELGRLFDLKIETPEAVIEVSRKLIAAGNVQVVVTSLGGDGAVLVAADQAWIAKAPEVTVKSKVGAGDSMVAGLISGLLKDLPFDEILARGIASGTAAVMRDENEACHRADFNQILPQVKITSG